MSSNIVIGSGGIIGLPDETTRDITYYVRSTGNDSNGGESTGDALLTLGEAISRVPFLIRHTLVIDVMEAGNFDGFALAGRVFQNGSLTIKGLLGTPTLVGATTGTGGAGSTVHQLVDATATWAVNELRGKLMKVNGEWRPVYRNTADTATFVGKFTSTTLGQTYEIEEQKTVLNTLGATSPLNAVIWLSNLKTEGSQYNTVQIQDFKIDGATAVAEEGVGIYNCYSAQLDRCDIVGGTYDAVFIQQCRVPNLRQCYLHDAGEYGIWVLRTTYLRAFQDVYAYNNGLDGVRLELSYDFHADRFCSSDNGRHGLYVWSCDFVDLDGGYFEDNTQYGIYIGDFGPNVSPPTVLSAVCTDPFVIDNNTSGGIFLSANAKLYLAGCSGTGNGGYGVDARSGSIVYFKSGVTVSGATADLTIDEGSTPLDWSTDFPINPTTIIHAGNACRVERRD